MARQLFQISRCLLCTSAQMLQSLCLSPSRPPPPSPPWSALLPSAQRWLCHLPAQHPAAAPCPPWNTCTVSLKSWPYLPAEPHFPVGLCSADGNDVHAEEDFTVGSSLWNVFHSVCLFFRKDFHSEGKLVLFCSLVLSAVASSSCSCLLLYSCGWWTWLYLLMCQTQSCVMIRVSVTSLSLCGSFL